MAEPFITVKSGASDIPDGVYPVILTEIKGPKTVLAQRGPKAGQEIDLLDWIFVIDQPNTPLDGKEIEVSSSMASGPRSKLYGFLTALYNGVAPQIGASFEKSALIGRSALATVAADDGGWPRITNLGALPIAFQQQRFATATAAPVQAAGAPATAASAAQPLRDAVTAGAPANPNGNLPF